MTVLAALGSLVVLVAGLALLIFLTGIACAGAVWLFLAGWGVIA